jgi:hypothetical protein
VRILRALAVSVHSAASAASCASSLAGQRIARRGSGTLPLQGSPSRTRSLSGRFARPAAVPSFVCPCGALSSALGRLTLGRRGKIDTGLPRLRQADCNSLFGRSCAVLTFANVMDFLTHELAGLRGWTLPGSLVCTRALNSTLRRHVFLPKELEDASRVPAEVPMASRLHGVLGA